MIREPAVAGQFYPGAKPELFKMVSGLVNKNATQKKALGIVSPHAGFIYSGIVSGAVFSGVKPAASYIVIGPNHTGRGRPFSLMKIGAWLTPFGRIQVNKRLAGDLLKRSRFLQDDPVAHAFEHSVETQIPFVQFVNEGATFVPIILSNAGVDIYREIGNDIAESIKQYPSDVLIVASSDMTHYEQQKIVVDKDKEAINAILELDEEKLLKKIKDFDISMCGYAPVVVMLCATKKLGAKHAELVKYQTSGDASGDYSAVVGYAGIIVS